jgi:hypothetical protein
MILEIAEAQKAAQGASKRQWSLQTIDNLKLIDYPGANAPTPAKWIRDLPNLMKSFPAGQYKICGRNSPSATPIEFCFSYGQTSEKIDGNYVATVSSEDRAEILRLTKELLKQEFETEKLTVKLKQQADYNKELLAEIQDLKAELREQQSFEDSAEPKGFLDNMPEWAQVVIAQAAPRLIDKLFPEDGPEPEDEPEPGPEQQQQGQTDSNFENPRQRSIYDELNEFTNYGG